MNKGSQNNIMLIGPMGAGKSTIGKLISETLSIPQHSIDKYRKGYYNEIGYDEEKSNNIIEKSGLYEAYKYWKPFEAYAVERFLFETHIEIIKLCNLI